MDEYTNPHFECVKKLLIEIVGRDNDTALINTELRALKTQYDSEIETIEDRCKKIRKRDTNKLAQHINNIDEVRELYEDKIKVLTEKKDKIYAAAKEYFAEFTIKKSEYYKFHEKTVNHLKFRAITCTDPQEIVDIEKKIKELNKLYLHDVLFIQHIEHDIDRFLQQLKKNVKIIEECIFWDYAFVPKGKDLDSVQALADEMKISNLPALRQALAQAHVYQPADIKSFVSAYLLHMDKCEQASKEKMKTLG